MRKRTRVAIAGVVAAVVTAGGASVAFAGGGSDGDGARDDGDVTVEGAKADTATTAALKATDGGTANSVERDSENGATWEVEVTRNDGNTVDVRLDENYQVVVIEGDGE